MKFIIEPSAASGMIRLPLKKKRKFLRYGRSWYQNILVLKYINIKALKHQNIGTENYFS